MTRRHGGLIALQGVPPALRPLVRAYILGYASSVAPRLLTLLVHQLATLRRRRNATTTTSTTTNNTGDIGDGDDKTQKHRERLLLSLQRVILNGFDWKGFPTFCAVLVGGSTLLEKPFRQLFQRFTHSLGEVASIRLSRWTSAFLAGWIGLRLLQSKQSEAYTELIPVKSDVHPGVKQKQIRYAGRTLDLSLFAVARAVDVVVGELWSRRRTRRVAQQKWTRIEVLVGCSTDLWVFACSSALVMWAWFYHRDRLPRTYHKWINSAAAVDDRLIQALQRCRSGEFRYRRETGQTPLLQPMCEEYGWPLAWGDPVKTVPIPCEMVHMGCGPSCEYHALVRFLRHWRWAMTMYLPLNLALQVRRGPQVGKALSRALVSAARSSAFLSTFITLFYYGVCLARTRIGPLILGTNTRARQLIDSGICVGTGCSLVGWSLMLEDASRRKDFALFVAPRALATLFPRKYAEDKQWRETLAFAASAAVVLTCVRENPARVRGVLGKILAFVLRT